mgnify:FL=1
MSTLEQRLLQALDPWRNAPAWRVAFSGGLDSTVLLHALTALASTEQLPSLSALHIQHGLQSAADDWPAHCQRGCAQLGVPLLIEAVTVDRSVASLEEAARSARYAAFERLLAPAEMLLTAQHQDDQAETLLFRLLRGAGLKGLAGMPQTRSLGTAMLLRPLLGVSRGELEAYAAQHALSWVEDPTNRNGHYSRNYLRHTVWPVLAQRWPAVTQTLARSAEHLAEAQALLDELAEEDLAGSQVDSRWSWLHLPSVEFRALLALSDARQRNALRAFLTPLTALPDRAHWAGWRDLRDASGDASPLWCLAQGELHRASGRLWWLSGDWLKPLSGGFDWSLPGSALQLPDNGSVSFSGVPPVGPLSVRYRRGGEQMTLESRGRRDLKRLLNEAQVPGFVRNRLPLLYCADQLLAVANLPALSSAGASGWKFNWVPPIGAQGLS